MIEAEHVTVGTSPAALGPSDGDGYTLIVRNKGTVVINVGPSNVTTGTGFEVGVDESISIDVGQGEIPYAVSGTAGQVVHVLRTRR